MCVAHLGLCEMWAADRGASVPVRSLRSEPRHLAQKRKMQSRREGNDVGEKDGRKEGQATPELDVG